MLILKTIIRGTNNENGTAHPGLLLAEQFETLGLKVQPTARDLGISRQQLHRVLKGKGPITADLAVKLGHMFANGAGLPNRKAKVFISLSA